MRPRKTIEPGTQVGKWTIVEQAEDYISRKTGKKNTKYWCKCCCGYKATVLGTDLRRGKSGGCKSCTRTKGLGVSAKNRLFRRYIKDAHTRRYSFNLSKELFLELTQKNCYYCNTVPSNKILRNEASLRYRNNPDNTFIYNGIDRIDNSRGYETDNVVPCCDICNTAKNTLSQKEFIEWIHAASAHLKENHHD